MCSLLHRPDALMDPDAVAEAFHALRSAGKVLHFGVSNHSPSQFALLHRRFPLVANQIELSALQTQALADGTLDQAVDLGLRPMIWSPLAGGRLFTATDERARRVREALGALARSQRRQRGQPGLRVDPEASCAPAADHRIVAHRGGG